MKNIQKIVERIPALDYIAYLAIATSLLTHEYIVCIIIVIMLAGGNALEAYGNRRAKQALTALADRIPHQVLLMENGNPGATIPIESVRVNQEIAIRRGEVIPLDGHLISEHSTVDESSLTGEPYPVEKQKGDPIRSGTVNVGDLMIVHVEKSDQDSSYRKIIRMVQAAQQEKSPLIRLADQYSRVFTLITLVLAGVAFLLSHSFDRVLAVLVIATPCPLILATPIALMGGVNAAAQCRIIVKRLANLEVLSRVDSMILDKTGTITFGHPTLETKETTLLGIAAAIERNSLHPFAKTIVETAKSHGILIPTATNIHETIGKSIEGKVKGVTYTLKKTTGDQLGVSLYEGTKVKASFLFRDELKPDSAQILRSLHTMGITLSMYTGDTMERATQALAGIKLPLTIHAQCTPEDKKKGIEELKRAHHITAMVGDGINDAPALALADVGLVFSNEEQTASSEAADIVFLGGNLEQVAQALLIARHTLHIARQSILFGIGLSIAGMCAASIGLIPPLAGAILQEAIDVAVILNALRASRYSASGLLDRVPIGAS